MFKLHKNSQEICLFAFVLSEPFDFTSLRAVDRLT